MSSTLARGLFAIVVVLSLASSASAVDPPAGIETTLRLAPVPGHPRNSEGDFIALKDGRLLFVYSHFTGGGGDHDQAFLAGRYSSDGGRTWTDKDEVIVERDGDWNVMSVSLLRLKDGSIGLF